MDHSPFLKYHHITESFCYFYLSQIFFHTLLTLYDGCFNISFFPITLPAQYSVVYTILFQHLFCFNNCFASSALDFCY